MATGVESWSTTAATNSTADSAVNWAEGMAPSAVNDSARATMASVAKYRVDLSGSNASAGGTTAYTLTTSQVLSSLAAGRRIAFQANATNTGTSTINVDSLGAKPLRSAPNVELVSGDLVIGKVYSATYFTSNSGEWVIHGTIGAFGILKASGAVTLASTLAVTGAATLASTLGVTGDVAVNTNKFNVTAASGNTTVAGTLGVTGASTVAALTASGAVTHSSTSVLTGTVRIGQNTTDAPGSSNTTVGAAFQVDGNGATLYSSRTSNWAIWLNQNNSGDVIQHFAYQGTTKGNITVTSSAVSYNTSSDYRLKENQQPMTGALTRIGQLKPYTFDWIADGQASEGFFAHELAEVVPLAVTGAKDAVYDDDSIKPQSVDLSKVVPVLVAAIQELTARVVALGG